MPEATSADPPQLRFVTRLSPSDVAAVAALVNEATEVDGVRPLSEHVMLHLRHGAQEKSVNVLMDAGERLAGYGHLDVSDTVAGASAEVVVHPQLRRKGYGRLLVEAMATKAPEGCLRLWAHGEHPAAAALARALGLSRSRVLWQMRRSLYAALPVSQVPPGINIRTFVPGQDDQSWVELNRTAFAGHPEQARWTAADLRVRMSEPWFDPDGFFLAEREGRLVGFHWTKVHGAEEDLHRHGHPPIGEVYVVGVHPGEHGKGLGRALTLLGLQHLRQRGLPEAMLYVEADNAPAVALYEQLGFARWATDVMFSAAGAA